MNDCIGREISVGDEVGFTVGTNMVTGIVHKLRINNYNQEVAKVELTKPEPRPDSTRWVRDENGYVLRDEHDRPRSVTIVREPLRFRDVVGSYRIVILKGIKQ